MSDPRTKELPLPGPVKVGGLTLTKVTMREPFIQDELDAAADAALYGRSTQAEVEVRLLSILTGIDYDHMVRAPRGFRLILAAALMDFTSTPWIKSDETPSSSPDSQGESKPSAA